MTAQAKSAIRYLSATALVSISFVVAYIILHHMGIAHADPMATPPTPGPGPDGDPASMLGQFYDFMRSGKGTAAVGVAFMLIAYGLRSGLGSKWRWWKTPAGGYLLGFGLPVITYFGTALETSAPVTISLVLNALGAGWVAAGGWEHLRDVMQAMRKPGAAAPAAGAGVLLVMLVLSSATLGQACKNTPTVAMVKTAAVQCGQGELAKLESIAIAAAPAILSGQLTWDDVETAAVKLGKDAGGCFISHVWDESVRLAAIPAGSGSAAPAGFSSRASGGAAALAKFRSDAHTDATYLTPVGEH